MKILKRVTLSTVCISILYILISQLLSRTELSLRTWVNVLGQVIMVLVTPLLLIVLILMLLWQSARIHRGIKLAVTVMAVAGYIYCGFYLFLFILFGTQEEKMLTRHLLVTNESGFLGESNYVYYRPAAFFFKTPGELTNEDKIEYLGRKYQRVFEADGPGGEVHDVEYPEVEVNVYLSGMELTDDYVDGLTFQYLSDGYGELGIERDYRTLNFGAQKRDYMCLMVDGYADIPAAAEDISRLADYAMDRQMPDSGTSVYQENQGRIYFSFGDDENGYTGVIYFGEEERKEAAQIESVIREGYSHDVEQGIEEAHRLKEAQKQRSEAMEESDGTGTSAGYIGEADEGKASAGYMEEANEREGSEEQRKGADFEADNREEAAKTVYDAVLAAEGYAYEVCYNAKGNLYIDLGVRTSDTDNGKTYAYRLVYDRPSKNGACELFVLYRAVEGSGDEAIVDMYAVENHTGRVVASGKKAWSDVGTAEYREMTGE